MTDKELLELAAKAAGITDGHWLGDCFWVGAYDGGYEWKPLIDDGDALRLAVKLNMIVSVRGTGETVVNYNLHVLHHNDPYAATRRAIVRAAAEIGKEMK